MRANWTGSTVVNYSSAQGKLGDDWRQRLVNPAVFQVLSDLCQPKHIARYAPIEHSLCEQRKWLRDGTDRTLLQWHTLIQEQNANRFAGTVVLDLGCGEGYLNRWLAPMGIVYQGVDGSKGLLEQAVKKTSSGKGKPYLVTDLKKVREGKPFQATLAEIDLDDDKSIAKLSRFLGASATPALIVATIVLDHLCHPEKILNWLNENLPETPLLLFTLNPDYFGKTDVEPNKPQAATIASANEQVTVVFRAKQDYDVLLRDSRYLVRQSALLNFELNEKTRPQADQCPGIAPFLAFLATPQPKAVRDQVRVRAALEALRAVKGSALNALSSTEYGGLLEHAQDLELIDYPKDDVLAPNNIGGDLLVVVSGQLRLVAPRGGFEIPFKPGDMLGEVETGSTDDRCAYYLYPVKAIEPKNEILRIPCRLLRPLMEDTSGLHSFLFRRLREKLSITEWEYGVRDHNPDGHSTKDKTLFHIVDWKDSDKVARALLAASQAERLSGSRGRQGRSILLDNDILASVIRKAARKTVKSNNKKNATTPVNEVLRFLTWMGIADGFAGAALLDREDSKYLWAAVLKESCDLILKPGLAETEADWLDNNIVKDITADLGQMVSKGSWTKRWVDPTNSSSVYVKLMNPGPRIPNVPKDWKERVERWFYFLYRVNSLLHDKAPQFIYVHDFALLRALATEGDKCLQGIMEDRLEALGLEQAKSVKKSFSVMAETMQKDFGGRLAFYIDRLRAFLLADLRANRGALEFSGLGRGAEPPPFQQDPKTPITI